MALSDHHYTSAQFHLHLIILISRRAGEEECTRVPARPRASARALRAFARRAHAGLCTLRYRVSVRARTHALARLSEGASRQGKRERLSWSERGRHLHTMRPLHLMQVPFAPYCLSHHWGRRRKRRTMQKNKKQVIWLSPGEAADPFFPPASLCLFVAYIRGRRCRKCRPPSQKERKREREKMRQNKDDNIRV